VVVGAGSGIGFALAEAFAARGLHVLTHSDGVASIRARIGKLVAELPPEG